MLSGLFCAAAGAAHSAVSAETYMGAQTGLAVGLTLAGMATMPGWFGTSVFRSLEAGNGVLAAGTVSAVAGAITFCV